MTNGAKMCHLPSSFDKSHGSFSGKKSKVFQYISAEVAHSPYSSDWTWLESAASSEGPEQQKENQMLEMSNDFHKISQDANMIGDEMR